MKKNILALFLNLAGFVCIVVAEANYEKSTNVNNDRKTNIKNLAADCKVNKTCVRFCCDNESACLEKQFLNLSLIGEAKNLELDFKILIGRPNCESMFELEAGETWEFLKDGKVSQTSHGEQRIHYDHNQYCFDQNNETNRMLICFADYESDSESRTPSEASYPICKNEVD